MVNKTLLNHAGHTMLINVQDHGVHPDNTDNANALETLADFAWTSGLRHLIAPAGTYKVSRPVNVSGVTLWGTSPTRGTEFVNTTPKDQAVGSYPGTLFVMTGRRPDGTRTSGGGLRMLKCGALAGAAMGDAVFIRGDNEAQQDLFILEDLRITVQSQPEGGQPGTWTRGIYISGADRTVPLGVRGGSMRRIEVFNTTQRAITVWSGHGIDMEHVRCITGGGSASAAGIVLGGSAGNPCGNITGRAINLDGDLIIQNSSQCSFEGIISGNVTIQNGLNAIRVVDYGI